MFLWLCSRLYRFRRLTIRFGLTSLIAIALVLSGSAIRETIPTGIAHGQLPSATTDASNNPLNRPDGVTRSGEYETAWIQSPLDSKQLFEVTSRTILNRDKVPEGKLPIEVRAQEVNERLWRVLNRTYFAKKTPTVTIATLNNRPIIQISDDQSTRPIRLVTVTEPDADWNGRTLDELAQG